MKQLQSSLLLGVIALPLIFSVQAGPRSQYDLQGQNPQILADQLTQDIRSHQSEVASPQRAAALRAIAAAGEALAAGLDPASMLWRRVQADRLYALSLAGSDQDVVAVYRTMQAHGAETPSYVVAAIAQALARTGRTEEAAQVLQQAAVTSPADPAPAIRYAYLRADQGQYDAAIRHLEQWIANARSASLDTAAVTDAQLVLALLQRWDERFDAAERTLAKVDAPHAGSRLAAERAALQRQRGRPRASLDLLDQATSPDARATLASAWMDLGRPDRARAVLGPDGDAALKDRIDTSLRSRGLVSARYAESRSNAIASPNGAQESGFAARVDGPWLGNGWRIGGHFADRRAEFRGITPAASYAAMRLVRAVTGGEAVLEIGRSFDEFLGQNHAIAESSTWINDHVRAGARIAINDPGSSLQARASGIGSDTAGVSATYRDSERWRLDGGINAARFDDGNRRWSMSFGGESRLRAAAGRVTSAFAGAYASRSSLDDAAYFNPRRDASLEAGLVHGFQGFAGSWHSLRPSVSRYWQQGFGGKLVPRLGYSARIGSGAGHWWQLDLAGARPVYDGRRETQWSIALSRGWGE